MLHTGWLWKGVICLFCLSALFFFGIEGQLYDKCSTPDGRLGICVVKLYCRESNANLLQKCEGDHSYCCPIVPTTQKSEPDRHTTKKPREYNPEFPENRQDIDVQLGNRERHKTSSRPKYPDRQTTKSPREFPPEHPENRKDLDGTPGNRDRPISSRPTYNDEDEPRKVSRKDEPRIDSERTDRFNNKSHSQSPKTSGKPFNPQNAHVPRTIFEDDRGSFSGSDQKNKRPSSPRFGDGDFQDRNRPHDDDRGQTGSRRSGDRTSNDNPRRGSRNTARPVNKPQRPSEESAGDASDGRKPTQSQGYPRRDTSKNGQRGNERRQEEERRNTNHNPEPYFPNSEELPKWESAPPRTNRPKVNDPRTSSRYPESSVSGPKVPSCGVKPYELFIAGGEKSDPHEWPWMTAIFRRHHDSRPRAFLCGGSLINTRYVLTAAHCFINNYVKLPASLFVVRLGSHYLNSGEEYTVSNLILHHNHSGSDFFNDIALVRLASEVYITDKIAPICLPFPKMMHDNLIDREATVSGWGDVAFRTSGTRVLQHVTIPIVSSEECSAAYSRVRGAAFLARGTDHVICAGLREGGKDACLGDSGGPLMLKTDDDRWVVIGVVSLGYKCAEPGYPGVYTRVTHYMSWLMSNMKRH